MKIRFFYFIIGVIICLFMILKVAPEEEFFKVWLKASKICLECIGIG